jgi:hypothetical protein
MTALQLATLAVARKTRQRKDEESQHQQALVMWASMARFPVPVHGVLPSETIGDYLFAIPNGGARSKAVAGRMKAEGLKAGVLDLKFELPIGRCPGLWIEMKAGKNTLTPEQRTWRERMARLGFKVVVCWDWEVARDHILEYLGAAPTRSSTLAALDEIEAGEVAVPKRKPIRSPKYLAMVAKLACCNCSIVGYSQAAHPNTGKGMATKADDNLAFPLCAPRPGEPGCHARFDQGAMYTKAQRRELETRWGRITSAAIKRTGKWPMGLAYPTFKE